MRKFLLINILLFLSLSIFAQCDCDKIDQKDGTYYTKCKPFLIASDSNGTLRLGISGLGQFRFIHAILSFKTNPQIFNGGLNISAIDGNGWIGILIQDELKLVDSVPTAYGVYSIENWNLNWLENNKIQSITYYLTDGQHRTMNITYLGNDISNQVSCIKSQEMNEYRQMASDAREKKEYENAIGFINKAIAVDSNFIENYISKGYYLTALKRFQEAYDTYSLGIKIDSNYSNSYNLRAGLLARMGQDTQAIADYTTAIRHAENLKCKVQYLNNRAVAKDKIKDINGELDDINEALKLDSNYLPALNSMGNALSKLGRNKEGLYYLLKGLKLDSTNYTLQTNIGFIYQDMNEHIIAINYFNKAIELNPNLPEGFSNRSYSYYHLGKTEAALVDINKSIELWNTNSYAYWVRALIFIKQNELNNACNDLKTASKLGYTNSYGSAVDELTTKYCK